MLVRVTCSGIEVGTAEFEPLEGLAHARVVPGPGYNIALEAARAMGWELALRQYWSPLDGDFADIAAGRWSGGRLALEDFTGRELGVNNIVLLESPIVTFGVDVRIVADFRPDLARVEAFLQTIRPSDTGRTRPAA